LRGYWSRRILPSTDVYKDWRSDLIAQLPTIIDKALNKLPNGGVFNLNPSRRLAHLNIYDD
jgi:hypothetical protein